MLRLSKEPGPPRNHHPLSPILLAAQQSKVRPGQESWTQHEKQTGNMWVCDTKRPKGSPLGVSVCSGVVTWRWETGEFGDMI